MWDELIKRREKEIFGKTLQQAVQLPNVEDSLRFMAETLLNPLPPRKIGLSKSGAIVSYNDFDRIDHFHILGAPNQGKSKFLETMMSEDILDLQNEDIDFRSGFCFLDAGPNANTMRKVLGFCVEQNFKKVLLVDPYRMMHDNVFVPINPLTDTDPPYSEHSEVVSGHMMEIVRYLWGTGEWSTEAIIRKYLPKVFKALHNARVTIPESDCFTEPAFAGQVNQILNYEERGKVTRHLDLKSKLALERARKGRDWVDFQSSARRLDVFYTDVFKGIFGSQRGVDFEKLIRDGWVILVNLFPGEVYSKEHSKLLGLVVMSELARALTKMTKGGYAIPYNIFIDEAGLFATRNIAHALDYYRHLNIRLTIAHQGFDQIEDPFILAAIRRSAKNKILFYAASHADRYAMCRDMNYGGELPMEQVTYTLGSTPKQEAVVRIGKLNPVLTSIKQWPDPTVSPKEIDEFVKQLYKDNPQMYRPRADVWGEINNRFERPRTNPQPGGEPEDRPKKRVTKSNHKEPDRGHKGADVEDAPVGQPGPNPDIPARVKRTRGIPSTLLSKRKPDDK